LLRKEAVLPFEKALEIVLTSARQVDTERIDFACAFNRVLAEEVRSDVDIPPFNKSAMDGFACRRTDLANELAIVETIPAGYTPTKSY
jgi:molybdopterin molybdotransferase